MNNLQLTVPSKTFLVGEYLALLDGPCILISTAPRFKLKVKKATKQAINGINPYGIAMQFIKNNQITFNKLSINFLDPYEGLGGFGASSAEFVLLYSLKNLIVHKKIDIEKLITNYKSLTHLSGYQPSGADLASQFCGEITLYNGKNFSLKKFNWPFANLGFFLIHTNNKLDTRKHLMKLTKSKLKTANLKKIVLLCTKSIEETDEINFCKAINLYNKYLQKQNLICDKTTQILNRIFTNKNVLAAKGCGALGSDVILVITAKKHKNQFLKWARQNKLTVIATNNNISPGIEVNMKPNNTKKEMLISVNKRDEQIGLIEKITAHKEGILHRAFSIVIYRKKKNNIELLLQKRAATKYHSPGLWSNTCCSHPHNNESLYASAKKRLKMEMRIDVLLRNIGQFYYKSKLKNGFIEHEIDHVFIGKLNSNTIRPNRKEVAEYCWIDINSLKNAIKNYPELFTPWLSKLLKFISKNKKVF